MRGRLVPSLEQLEFLETVDLHSNALTGPLPLSWGNPGTFPQLVDL